MNSENVKYEADFRDAVKNVVKTALNNKVNGWQMKDYRCGTPGAEYVRNQLDDRFKHEPLDRIRMMVHNCSGKIGRTKSGKGKNGNSIQTTDMAQKMARSAKQGRRTHSPEYTHYVGDWDDGIETSPLWDARRKQHLIDCNYTCQLCGQWSASMDVHHVIYPEKFDGTEHWSTLLCVCSDPCHGVADFMRQRGKKKQEESEDDNLWESV